jgi:hypothetical protein
MQGRSITLHTAEDRVASLKLKLKCWYQLVQRIKLDCFDTMNEYLEESSKAILESVKNDMTEHLKRLQNSFEEYFPPNYNDSNRLTNSISGSFQLEDFSVKDYEQLTDTASDSILKQTVRTVSLPRFWASVTEEDPEPSKCAVGELLPSATAYLCESGFSRYSMAKTKYRIKLDAETGEDCS